MSLICSTNIEHLPTEVLQIIFAYYLPVKQLMKIRQVCSLWRDIIDGLAGSESFWRTHSKRDFSDVYNIAYLKAGKGKQWFNIYRSLTLWPQLAHAKEIRKEFSVVDDRDERISGMQVLQDGVVVGVLTNKVIYYDIDTMEPREPIRSYLTAADLNLNIRDFEENQHIIQFKVINVLNNPLYLAVIFKTVDNPDYKINATFYNVGVSLLINEEIFFVKYQDNNIYTCKLIDGEVKTTKLAEPEEKIICLGFTNQLYYITRHGDIYSLVNGNETFCCSDKFSRNILDQLYKYNLLKTDLFEMIDYWYESDETEYFPDVNDMGPFLSFLQSIRAVKVYGKVVLVCERYTYFYIYYDPFINGEFDIWNSQPVKKYSFGDLGDCCSNVDVDVLETEDGHIVLVALLDRIIALDLVHPLPKLK